MSRIKNAHVFSYTLGESLQENQYNIENLSIELLRNLERFESSRLILLGHSFGAALIIKAYSEIQKRFSNIESLIFSNWICDNNWLKYFFENEPEYSSLKLKGSLKDRMLQTYDYYFSSKGFESVFQKIKYNDALLLKITTEFKNMNLNKHLSNISTPIYSISGSQDRIVCNNYTDSLCVLHDIPNYCILNVGHYPFIEAQDDFIRIIEKILNPEFK